MKQEKKLKNYCKEMLLDFYIDSNYLTIEGKDYLIVDGDELIFDSEFNFAPELNLELEEDTFGFVYEFGGIWYTQQVGAEISMSELKNTGKVNQKLSTEIFLGIHSGNEIMNILSTSNQVPMIPLGGCMHEAMHARLRVCICGRACARDGCDVSAR